MAKQPSARGIAQKNRAADKGRGLDEAVARSFDDTAVPIALSPAQNLSCAFSLEHGRYLGAPRALAQCGRRHPVATQTQRSNIQEVALASTLHHRQNVIGIPQTFTQLGLQSPMRHQLLPSRTARPPQPAQLQQGVRPTAAAHALVAQKHLLPQVRRLRSQSPLVHAIRGAKRKPARRHFHRTPAAHTPAVRSARHRRPLHTATLHRSQRTHNTVLPCRTGCEQ